MFEWLERELSAIKTPRFHLVDGPADTKLREAVTQSDLPLPSSYKDFVLTFGNAKLYRLSRCGYRIGVFAGPREKYLADGTRNYEVGFHEGATAYFVQSVNQFEFPVFELESGSREMV